VEALERRPSLVASEILAAVGDVARPRGVAPFCRNLDPLPGRKGPLDGSRTVFGLLREGEGYMSGLAQRYGPVFQNRLGPTPIVCIAEPELLASALRNDDGAWSAAVPNYYFFGAGRGKATDTLSSLDFEPHREARRLLRPAFSVDAIDGYLEDAARLYDETITDWLRRGRIPFKAEVRRLFARVSAKIFLGIDDPAAAEVLDRALEDGWQAVMAIARRSPFSLRWWRARRGAMRLWSELRPRMTEPREGRSDLFSRLCQARDEAEWLTDNTRFRLFIGMLFAAFDTTASGTTSMAYLLARHPAWQERLRDEAIGLATARPSQEQLRSLEQHELVWKETLRVFPVGGLLTRMTLREVTHGPWRIPPAALVILLMGTVMHDPRWWSDPQRFDPDRFSPQRAEDKRHKATYIPFGVGPHACIGAQLAAVEIKAFWHAMLSRCRFRLARPYDARHTYHPIGIVSGDVELIVEAG
jgi:cytochrome P450